MIAYKLSDENIEITPEIKNSILETINKYIVDHWDNVITIKNEHPFDDIKTIQETVVYVEL